jgi:hypothetical protein
MKWTRLSCRTFAANAVRLQLHALAYNLANFMRTLAIPKTAEPWSLTSLREKLVKIGAKVVSHGRYVSFQLAEVAVPRQMFADILSLIARLRARPGRTALAALGIVAAGAMAGAAMALSMGVWSAITGTGLWFPLNLIAATFLNGLQTATPEVLTQFNLTGTLVGMLLHLSVSTLVGLLFALLLPTLPGSPRVWALIAGPLLWLGANAVLPVVNPALFTFVNPVVFLFSHIVYALTLGWWVSRASTIPLLDWDEGRS